MWERQRQNERNGYRGKTESERESICVCACAGVAGCILTSTLIYTLTSLAMCYTVRPLIKSSRTNSRVNEAFITRDCCDVFFFTRSFWRDAVKLFVSHRVLLLLLPSSRVTNQTRWNWRSGTRSPQTAWAPPSPPPWKRSDLWPLASRALPLTRCPSLSFG